MTEIKIGTRIKVDDNEGKIKSIHKYSVVIDFDKHPLSQKIGGIITSTVNRLDFEESIKDGSIELLVTKVAKEDSHGLPFKKFTSKQKSEFVSDLLTKIESHYKENETMDATKFGLITITSFGKVCNEDQQKEVDNQIGKMFRETYE